MQLGSFEIVPWKSCRAYKTWKLTNPFLNVLIIFIFIFFTSYLFLRERDRAREGEGQGKREKDTESEAGSRLRAVSTEPDTGLELTNLETMT